MPKIAILDIETAPLIAYSWGPMWETSLIEIIQEGYILSFAYKWLGDKKVNVHTLADYSSFGKFQKAGLIKPPDCDRQLCKDALAVLEAADVVVAHNGKKFDAKWLTSRFLKHGLKPPSPYKIFDTLLEHRKVAMAPSHKLDDLGNVYGLGRKKAHTGRKLWLDCVAGKRSAFRKMAAYNRVDVELNERLYLRLRPYSATHPNLSHITRNPIACPTCESVRTENKGWKYYSTGRKHRRLCKSCGFQFVFGAMQKLNKV